MSDERKDLEEFGLVQRRPGDGVMVRDVHGFDEAPKMAGLGLLKVGGKNPPIKEKLAAAMDVYLWLVQVRHAPNGSRVELTDLQSTRCLSMDKLSTDPMVLQELAVRLVEVAQANCNGAAVPISYRITVEKRGLSRETTTFDLLPHSIKP